jgi:hypothetical protein
MVVSTMIRPPTDGQQLIHRPKPSRQSSSIHRLKYLNPVRNRASICVVLVAIGFLVFSVGVAADRTDRGARYSLWASG